jgi:hypothetical protein
MRDSGEVDWGWEEEGSAGFGYSSAPNQRAAREVGIISPILSYVFQCIAACTILSACIRQPIDLTADVSR